MNRGDLSVFPTVEHDGITIRELIAGMAMIGYIIGDSNDEMNYDAIARRADRQADEMLLALADKKEGA